MGAKTILYADDDPLMQRLVLAVLEHAGMAVTTSSNGVDALGVLAERSFDVLITDIRMPKMTGFELAHRAKLLQPNLKVIYLSAHFSDAERSTFPLYGVLMEKPVEPSKLRREVNRAIGSA